MKTNKNQQQLQETTLLTVQVHIPKHTKHKEMEEQIKLIKQVHEIEKKIHFDTKHSY